jgi:Ca-activated chloride channel homolog
MSRALILAFVAIVLLAPYALLANGVLVVNASSGVYARVDTSAVAVDIQGQVAITTSTQIFRNVTGAKANVVYAFPMPAGASATRLRWKYGSVWWTANFAAQAQDSTLPGSGGTIASSLKSFLGDKPLYFTIPWAVQADSLITVELTYVELLPYSFGTVTYKYPNRYALIQATPMLLQSLSLSLSSTRTIESAVLAVPMGGMVINTGTHATASYQRSLAKADSDYVFKYVLRSTELGLFSFSTKPSDTLGYFTFMVEPDPSSTDIIRKNFAVIIDRSGSMGGDKIVQARNAAAYIVNNLNEGDRFTLVDFDNIITPFRQNLVPYLNSTRDSALTYINGLTARGSTDIEGAFATTLPYFAATSDTAANIIIFLTDGQPTWGVTQPDSIVARITRNVAVTKRSIYIFTFGIGTDVNTQLLTLIASTNAGLAAFLGNDQLEARITQFYNTIRNPVIIAPKISFSSPSISEPYPSPLPNLYKGQQLLVSGIYTTAAPGTVTFSGTRFGQPVSYQYQLALADSAVVPHAFLPKLWAKLKIEFLLVRYYSAPAGSTLAKELKKAIQDLSIQYGVVSPFTSFSGGTPSTGVERGSIDAFSGQPSMFELIGNYPNPFNAGTVIRFRVAAQLHRIARVSIYNNAGQLVRELSLPVTGAGEYSIAWDARGQNGMPLPSGAYFYIIDMGEGFLAGRMLLIK